MWCSVSECSVITSFTFFFFLFFWRGGIRRNGRSPSWRRGKRDVGSRQKRKREGLLFMDYEAVRTTTEVVAFVWISFMWFYYFAVILFVFIPYSVQLDEARGWTERLSVERVRERLIICYIFFLDSGQFEELGWSVGWLGGSSAARKREAVDFVACVCNEPNQISKVKVPEK